MKKSVVSYEEFSVAYDRVILNADLFEAPEYYRQFKNRYWRTLRHIEARVTSDAKRILDIGSGQFALLCRLLLDAECDVADIESSHTAVLEANGIGFYQIDLTKGGLDNDRVYDLIVMAEVIEHVPRPPHMIFEDLKRSLRPNGAFVITTPNLYRLRNVFRMIMARPIFCNFTFPRDDRPLGHFLEYSREQMIWQLEQSGLQIELAMIEQLDFGGATIFARWARRLSSPLLAIRPLWRDNLLFVARRSADSPQG